jgi:hypothetical protein
MGARSDRRGVQQDLCDSVSELQVLLSDLDAWQGGWLLENAASWRSDERFGLFEVEYHYEYLSSARRVACDEKDVPDQAMNQTNEVLKSIGHHLNSMRLQSFVKYPRLVRCVQLSLNSFRRRRPCRRRRPPSRPWPELLSWRQT